MGEIEVIREGGRMVVRASRGSVVVEFPEPDIALITYDGVGLEAFVGPVTAEIEARAVYPVVLAVDGEALSSYETGFRKRWTDWMSAHQPRAVYILSGSRLVVMGITLANAVLGGTIRGFASRVEFRRAVEALGSASTASRV